MSIITRRNNKKLTENKYSELLLLGFLKHTFVSIAKQYGLESGEMVIVLWDMRTLSCRLNCY